MRLSTTSRRVGGRPWASPPSTARTVSSAMNALPAERCQTSASRSDRPGAQSATSSASTLARQRRQIQRRDLLVAPQLGERHGEVRGGAGRVVAERGHHQHRLVGEDGDEVGDEVAGGPVGPVQVLDHQQHRAQLGQLGDRLVQQVEQPHRRALAAGRTAAVPATATAAPRRRRRAGDRTAVRSAERTGQNGGASAMSMALPVSTTASARRACRTSSPTSFVLPTPASPPTSTAPARPSQAAWKASVSVDSSRERPRNPSTAIGVSGYRGSLPPTSRGR